MTGRALAPVRIGFLAVGLLLVTVAGLAGCGVPTDSEPRAITAESTTTPPAESSTGPASGEALIYLSTPPSSTPDTDASLVPVPRNLGAPPDPTSVLRALFDGPTKQEQDERKLTTLIPEGTTVEKTTLDADSNILTVDLSQEWSDLISTAQVGGYGQVVLTVTGLDGVDRVRFRVDGESIDAVPTEDDPKPVVSRIDYLGLTSPGG